MATVLSLSDRSRQELRCSDFDLAQRADPCGTAKLTNTIVLVNFAGPWPRAAMNHPELADALEVISRIQKPGTMVLLSVPSSQRPTGTVEIFSRSPSRFHSVLKPTNANRLVERLNVAHNLIDSETCDLAPDFFGTQLPPLLICIHGNRDVCCGTIGSEHADEVAAVVGEERIRRVSHFGGHRFAATAIDVSTWTWWAHLKLEDSLLLLSPEPPKKELVEMNFRGWSGTPAGGFQYAVRHLLLTQGWAALSSIDCITAVTDGGDTDRGVKIFEIFTTEGNVHQVLLRDEAPLPHIDCQTGKITGHTTSFTVVAQ